MPAPAFGSQFRAIELLGTGAAGEVYLVENLALQRLEALKILKRLDGRSDVVARARFHREARATRLLKHQNIVATYDCGELPDGRLYLTMEYVRGVGLATLLAQRGPLPIAMTLGILAECGDAIDHAHRAGVVHRDLKPHNLLLADHPDGKLVRILDFGLAKILNAGDQDNLLVSADGAIFGTPQYMSPEQCRGLPPDPRTDLYALGCVAFELLVGEPPFRGSLPKLFAMHTREPARPPSAVDPGSGIPAELDAVVLRCLEKAPERRFQTGGDLCAAVQAVPGYRPLRQPRG